MQHSDLPIPRAALIVLAACDLHASAVRLRDDAAARRITRLIDAVRAGASFAWDGGTLIVGSLSGHEYQVTQARCSCPNGQKGLHECWHWLSYGLLSDLTETAIETMDMEADLAAQAQAQLAERLRETARFLSEQRALLGRRLVLSGRYAG